MNEVRNEIKERQFSSPFRRFFTLYSMNKDVDYEEIRKKKSSSRIHKPLLKDNKEFIKIKHLCQ